MTTTDLRALLGYRYDDATETITVFIHDDERDPQSKTCPVCRPVADRALSAVLPDLLDTAWAEGYVASAIDANSGFATPNPYRTTATATHCDRRPCHLPAGHGGPCNPGDDANTDEMIVRTVGDLTARHIGRRVRVETDRTLPDRVRLLREIATASSEEVRLTLDVIDHPGWFLMAWFDHDTPCEVIG